MGNTKFLYITHLSGKRVNRLWISAIQAANELGYEVHLACNMSEIESGWWDDCKKYRIKAHQIDFNRNPIRKDNIKAYRQLLNLMQIEEFSIVHCNTPIGGVLGRVCAHKAKIPHVIYQAHGFHFWKGAPLKNWLLYYPIERALAHYTDVLITINTEDYHRAKRFNLRRGGSVVYVHGVGIDLNQFQSISINKEDKRAELQIKESDVMLLSVGELIERKNHEVILKAIKKLSNSNLKYCICGAGEREQYLRNLAKKLKIEDQVIFLGFRQDVSELCNVADLFVFPSKQEGMPVALMEAIACKTPVICSNIRGNIELVSSKSCLFSVSNIDEITQCIRDKLCGSDLERNNLKANMKEYIEENYTNILKYDLRHIIDEINDIYTWGGVELNKLFYRCLIRRQLNIPLEALVFLSIGELTENKNHRATIMAFKKANIENSYYIICGEGVLKEQLTRLVSENHLEKRVQLLGFRSDVENILYAADVFLFPSLREGLSVALMEAMAVGLPCVAGRIRGNTDLLSNSMLLCDTTDIDSIKDKMQMSLVESNRFKEKEKNLKRIKDFQFFTVKDELKKIYKQDYQNR